MIVQRLPFREVSFLFPFHGATVKPKERRNMNFNDFINNVSEIVTEKLNGEGSVSVKEVLKNNGVRLQGLMIRTTGRKASPTVYLERFYDEYLGGKSVEEIAESILTIYRENIIHDDSLPDLFDAYQKAKKHLYLKAVNRDRNEELLADVPHMDFLDLALIPYILIKEIGHGSASVVIHNEMVRYWELPKKQILADAMENMIHHYGYRLTPMKEMLKDMLPEEDAYQLKECPNKMYVLLSPGMQYSAALIAVDSIMSRIAERLHSDLIILPSSIHELIVIPDDLHRSCNGLDELVKCVNETSVSAEEVLSDHAYRYKRDVGYVTA